MNVFGGRVKDERPAVNLLLDGFQAADDGLGLRRSQNPLPGQHPGMGHGTHEVIAIQPPVKMQRRRKFFHMCVSRGRKTPLPGFLGSLVRHIFFTTETQRPTESVYLCVSVFKIIPFTNDLARP